MSEDLIVCSAGIILVAWMDSSRPLFSERDFFEIVQNQRRCENLFCCNFTVTIVQDAEHCTA